MVKGYRQFCIAAGLVLASSSAWQAEAQDGLNLDDLRREFKHSAAAGALPAGFDGGATDAASVSEAGRKLAQDEELLLQQLNQKPSRRAPTLNDDALAPVNGAALEDEVRVPAVKVSADGAQEQVAVETRFLDSVQPIEAAPAVENPAEVVAARMAERDDAQVQGEAPPIAEPVAAPKAVSKTSRKAPAKEKVAAIERAAMSGAEASSSDEQSYAELQDLIKRHGVMKADLKRQSDAAVKLRKKNDDLGSKLTNAEAKIKSLEQELTEARNRLIISETEVERLSGLMLTTVKSAQSMARMNGAGADQSGAQRAHVTAVVNRRPAAPQPSDEMPVATVVVEKANLRTGPGSEHSPLMSVTQGTRLLVETRRGEWYRVISPSGTRAWVAAEVVAFGASGQTSPTKTVKVKAYDASLEN